MRFLISIDYGGYNISDEADKVLRERTGYDVAGICNLLPRNDPALLQLWDEWGGALMDGKFSKLGIVEIPDDATDYRLEEYDGWERIVYVRDGKLYYTNMW